VLAGKEDPVEFDSSLALWGDVSDVVLGGRCSLQVGVIAHETPLPEWLLCSSDGKREAVQGRAALRGRSVPAVGDVMNDAQGLTSDSQRADFGASLLLDSVKPA